MSVDMTLYIWQILWALLSGIGIGIFAIFLRIKPISPKSKISILKAKKKLNAVFGIPSKESKQSKKDIIKRISKVAVDLFFGVFLGIFLTVFAYATNNGILRWFSLLAGIASFFLTLLFLNGPLTVCITVLLHSLVCVIYLCVNIIAKPCRIIMLFFWRLFLPIYRKCVLIFFCIRDRIRIVYQQSRMKRNLRLFKKCINKDIILWQKK